KKILFVHMFLTRISHFRGGQVLPKHGGNSVRPMIGGWEDLSGQVLIIAVNPHLTNGPISIRILASWICAAFLKISITTINLGGQTKMCCIFHRIGTGPAKKVNRSMYG